MLKKYLAIISVFTCFATSAWSAAEASISDEGTPLIVSDKAIEKKINAYVLAIVAAMDGYPTFGKTKTEEQQIVLEIYRLSQRSDFIVRLLRAAQHFDKHDNIVFSAVSRETVFIVAERKGKRKLMELKSQASNRKFEERFLQRIDIAIAKKKRRIFSK